MKAIQWLFRLVGSSMLLLSIASGVEPRQNINPALLYWQAFNKLPVLSEAESKLLADPSSGDVTEVERTLAGRFDSALNLIKRARALPVPCDWGTDLADGPQAVMPDFGKIRVAASAGLLRARVALADGQQTRAANELLAISVLGRNAASGASLAGTMTQVVIENRVLDFVSANFDQLEAETRSEIAAGFRAPPRRLTVAEGMRNEKRAFYDWLLWKVEGSRRQSSDDGQVLAQFRGLIDTTFNPEKDLSTRIIEAAGGTSTGVLRYIRDIEPYYARSLAIATASDQDIAAVTAEFEAEVNSSTNLIALVVLPNIGKARRQELEFQNRLSQLR